MELPGLTAQVAMLYALPAPVTCQLLRAYTNDVYLVTAGPERYVLKIYGFGWRTAPEIRAEIMLLEHLRQKGVPVPRPLAGRDNDTLQQMSCGSVSRPAVLFSFAPGEKPQPPFTLTLYEQFGAAIAQLHTAADDFTCAYSRVALDLDCLLHVPLACVLPHLAAAEDREFLSRLAERVDHAITLLSAQAALDWGPTHGDATLDNLHITPDGVITLYDFDSGGLGWRALDLQGWSAGSADWRKLGAAFRAGYTRIRPLNESNWTAAPFLTICSDIWGMQIDLERRVLAQGSARPQAYLREQIARLRERESALL